LVLVHGAGGSYLHWPAEIRLLVGEDILAIDLPGHGASPGQGFTTIDDYVEAVIGVLDGLSINQAVIAGHSMGGAIAQSMCLDYSDRIRALILIGSGAKLGVHPKLLQYCSSEDTYPKAVSLVVKWSFSPNTDPRIVELARGRMIEVPAHVLLADFEACNAFDLRERVTEIDQPTLLICGADDKMTPVNYSQFLFDNIPNARIEIVPNAGHMVMLERPGIVADMIKGFLQALNSGENSPA
jgi:pimeloyl-ACP methyl ester carboxylesterase